VNISLNPNQRKETLHTAQVSSIEELGNVLPDIRNNGALTHFIALAVNTSEISVCPFHLDGVDKKEIKNRLIGEAVETLSLPADAIELDYQVFDSSQDQTRGVYVCYPKKLLQDYLSTVDRSGYIPVKIVPSILAGIDSFLDQYKDQQGRLCLFDFSEDNMIYFAVFSNGHCDFLREIPFESGDEVEHEVIQSLRCACAISSIKKFDRIYFSGDVPKKDQIFKKVKKLFCENVTHGHFTNIEASLRRKDNIFELNLINKKTFSLKERKVIRQVMLGGLALCLLAVLVLGVKIFTVGDKIKHLESKYTTSDYNYALDVQRRLKELK